MRNRDHTIISYPGTPLETWKTGPNPSRVWERSLAHARMLSRSMSEACTVLSWEQPACARLHREALWFAAKIFHNKRLARTIEAYAIPYMKAAVLMAAVEIMRRSGMMLGEIWVALGPLAGQARNAYKAAVRHGLVRHGELELARRKLERACGMIAPGRPRACPLAWRIFMELRERTMRTTVEAARLSVLVALIALGERVPGETLSKPAVKKALRYARRLGAVARIGGRDYDLAELVRRGRVRAAGVSVAVEDGRLVFLFEQPPDLLDAPVDEELDEHVVEGGEGAESGGLPEETGLPESP